MLNTKLVALDLDGTLVDSIVDIAYCVDQMMDSIGRSKPGLAKVRAWVGNGVESLVRSALQDGKENKPPQSDYIKALDVFLSLYGSLNHANSALFPGVIEGLAWLSKIKIFICCITNKKRVYTLSLLEKLEIAEYFDLLVCGDDLPKRKPDPLPLSFAAQQLGIEPYDGLMIGDSSIDIMAARAAGFKAVAVSYGYQDRKAIIESKPDKVIDSLAELSTILTCTI